MSDFAQIVPYILYTYRMFKFAELWLIYKDRVTQLSNDNPSPASSVFLCDCRMFEQTVSMERIQMFLLFGYELLKKLLKSRLPGMVTVVIGFLARSVAYSGHRLSMIIKFITIKSMV